MYNLSKRTVIVIGVIWIVTVLAVWGFLRVTVFSILERVGISTFLEFLIFPWLLYLPVWYRQRWARHREANQEGVIPTEANMQQSKGKALQTVLWLVVLGVIIYLSYSLYVRQAELRQQEQELIQQMFSPRPSWSVQ